MMSQQTLAIELQNLVPSGTEAEAADALAEAYKVFALQSVSNNVPLQEAGAELGRSAMRIQLIGMNTEGQAASRILSGLIAFWAAVAAGLSASYAGATTIVPPPHAGFDLQPVFDANTAGNLDLEESTNNIAAVMFAAAIIGGTVTFGVPTFPIL